MGVGVSAFRMDAGCAQESLLQSLESNATFPLTLCFATDFCSGDQRPTSEAVALASCWVTGL